MFPISLKNVFFFATVASAFALGFYSLFLASANADKKQPSNIAGFLRTATAVDTGKINIALGDLTERDLVYVVLYTAEAGPEPEVEIAARRAAQTLSDSSMSVSVRLLDPGDSDFSKIVTQNGVGRFPAVLTVKKNGGIVLVTDKINEKNLLHAYHGVWGKASSCVDAGSAIY